MCGRYTLKTRAEVVAEHFQLPEVPVLPPRYNIAPSQPVAVVRDGPELARLRWGLIPAWADDPAIGHRMINARAETVAERPAFRAAFRRRRCLILADGFYEWQRQDGPQAAVLLPAPRRRARSPSPGSGSAGRRGTSRSSPARC
jgi:putative SOS response-associated peptidase YedK